MKDSMERKSDEVKALIQLERSSRNNTMTRKDKALNVKKHAAFRNATRGYVNSQSCAAASRLTIAAAKPAPNKTVASFQLPILLTLHPGSAGFP